MTYTTVSEIAKLSGLSESTVRREIRSGHLSHSGKADKRFLTDADILEWLYGRSTRVKARTVKEKELINSMMDDYKWRQRVRVLAKHWGVSSMEARKQIFKLGSAGIDVADVEFNLKPYRRRKRSVSDSSVR